MIRDGKEAGRRRKSVRECVWNSCCENLCSRFGPAFSGMMGGLAGQAGPTGTKPVQCQARLGQQQGAAEP